MILLTPELRAALHANHAARRLHSIILAEAAFHSAATDWGAANPLPRS